MLQKIFLVGFRSLVEVELNYWALVILLNMENELMDVHQSDISKMLLSSTSNFVSFMLIKSCHFTWAYHVLLHKTSHTSYVLFFWFPHASSREHTFCFFEVRLFVALLQQYSSSLVVKSLTYQLQK